MLFNSQAFLVCFLPVVVIAYYACAKHRTLRVWLLIVASLGFYAYWDLRFLPLLVGSVCVNWLFARVFVARRSGLWLAAGVALNLIVLGLFKYYDFFADNLVAIGGWRPETWSLILPLGISFFTFQQISYLVDLYRGGARLYRFADYALYVTFFPQLIAGPIVRHSEIIFQYDLSPLREGLDERLSRGLTLLAIGLVKKVALADHLAKIVDPLYADASARALSFAESWLSAFGFGFQVYFDFSGYSDMAIGLGLIFGLGLPVNFNAPYVAVSIRDFWRRWHMTLSRFLRDYLYIPLGGSRHGPWRQAGALAVTMLLGGLWHGAAWTFVAWGGLHGLALAVNHAWESTGRRLPKGIAWALTMVFVFLSWVLFRADSFAVATGIWLSNFGVNGLSFTLDHVKHPWLVGVAAAAAILGATSQRIALEQLVPRRVFGVVVGLVLVAVLLQVGGGNDAEFVYFQF